MANVKLFKILVFNFPKMVVKWINLAVNYENMAHDRDLIICILRLMPYYISCPNMNDIC